MGSTKHHQIKSLPRQQDVTSFILSGLRLLINCELETFYILQIYVLIVLNLCTNVDQTSFVCNVVCFWNASSKSQKVEKSWV